ncbi:hypothetical protein RGQ29_008795 [Quercus rubra]|uniref:Uncharacterized protein n=3 Tax=Quercus rubra TaxID=3512 RepID=A0AAN7E1I3_QUERU|nr:hypothetical protein RGQ29_008795 [Quercus rubra]KAK4559755.1 hypothetical protein RGQ29_008795 [Quercus rubra]
MASASVVDNHRHNLRIETLPLIDLRLLSQSELFSLSLCSSSSSNASSLSSSNDNDDVLIPKIDRSVFNESAGSRKQTYSRLRLAPRKPQSPSSTSSSPFFLPRQIDEENSQIISLLKQLFASETHNHDLVPFRVEYEPSLPDPSTEGLQNVRIEYEPSLLPDSSNAGFQSVPIDVIGGGGGEMKRKRGRPRKNEVMMIERKVEVLPIVPVNVGVSSEGNKKRKRGRPRKDDKSRKDETKKERDVNVVEERVMVNEKGDVVDVAALGNVEDLYGEELKRRTEGLQTKDELLGFLSGLNGEWMSWRKNRRIVPASVIRDVLPRGWKLMLSIKKKAGYVWLHCRRYISPNGQQFVSCKEVSSYLLSFSGLQDASQPRSGYTDENFQLASKMDFGDEADPKLEDAKNADDLVSCSQLPMTSILTDEKQDTLNTQDSGIQTGEVLKCHKCSMTFDGKNDLVHHLISSHQSMANRCKQGTSIADGVIIKDGKYECQFCHKIFDERHRYNGHIGVHVRDYAKSVEALGGLKGMQKGIDPEPTRVLPSTSKMHESIGIGREKTSTAGVVNELSSGFSHGIIKVDNVTETCGDIDGHLLVLLSQDNQNVKANKDDYTLVEEYSDKQDKICNMNMDDLVKVDVATVFANRCNACPVDENSLKNENKIICESSDETNAHKCIPSGIDNCVAESKSFGSCSLAPPGNERAFVVENNVIEASVHSVKEPQLEIGSESSFLTLNGKDKCSGEDLQDKCLTSTVEDMKVDSGCTFENNESVSGFGNHLSGLKDVCTNVKQQCSSEVCSLLPFGNEQRSSLMTNENEIVSSFMLESLQEGSSGSSLCSLSTDKRTCSASNIVNNVSTSTGDKPRFDEVNVSGNNVIAIGFGSNHASQSNEAVISIKKDGSSGSSLHISSLDEECIVDNNVNKNPCCTMEEPFQGEASKSHVFAPSADEQRSDFDNNMNKVSTDTLEGLKLDEVESCKNNQLSIAFDRNETEVGVDTTACSEQEKCFKGSLLVSSADEHGYDIWNGTTKELKQTRGLSESGLHSQSDYEQYQVNMNDVNKVSCSSIEEAGNKKLKSPWSTELLPAFDTQAGLDVDVASTMQGQSSEGCSSVPSGAEQTFSADNDVTGVYISAVGELKHERGSKNGCEQVENKLNRVYTSTVWEQPRFEDTGKPRDADLMMGFGNHVQSNEDVMEELMWRTNEQNVQQSGLANSSSPLMPLSECLPNFDVMTSKGGDKSFSPNERFDSTSGLEGLGSSSIEHLEYNFLTMQPSPNPEESNVLSYDAEMEQGFDSSIWLKKEALPLLPKLASRHQVRTACVWCGFEFHIESANSGMQPGSVGFMCGTCKAKFSGQFNVL